MKRAVLIGFMLISWCYAQHYMHMDLGKSPKKKGIKKIRTVVVQDTSAVPYSFYTTENYDTAGHCVSDYAFSSTGDTLGGYYMAFMDDHTHYYIYCREKILFKTMIYNLQNMLVKQIDEYGDTMANRNSVFQYNVKGQLISKTEVHWKGNKKDSLIYDGDRLVMVIRYVPDKLNPDTMIYLYNEDQTISEITMYGDGGKMKEHRIYMYNKVGKPTKEITEHYFFDKHVDNTSFTRSYFYKPNGMLKKTIFTYVKGKTKVWVRETMFNSRGDAVRIKFRNSITDKKAINTREITYY